MEERWGLDLDMSAVRLMRRDGETWVEHGLEKIDSPDIEERLEKLISEIENSGPATLFLPRDQILYTRLRLDAERDARSQIEADMEGRTPYALDELSIDWEGDGNDGVWVAAIARDTLDEAAAFAEVRNLKVAGYSTLFSGEDFPRLPSFDGPDLVDPQPGPEKTPQFSTARVPSRPPTASVAAASAAASAKARFTPAPTPKAERPSAPKRAVSQPVIAVEDATPVVQVKAPQVPLDPGLPISAPNAPPRIRSDIGAASVSGHAASLTPPGGSVRMRKNRAPISTLAVFAVVFLLTVGIAVLVWNALPMQPGQTVEAPLDTGALPEALAKDGDDVVPPPELAEIDISPVETGITPPEPEVAPQVQFADLVGETAAPLVELAQAAPFIAKTGITLASLGPVEPLTVSVPRQPSAAMSPPSLPELDTSPPLLSLPQMEASVQTNPPFLGPEPDVDETSDSIFTSAFELPDPSTDAIALPNSAALTADPLPQIGTGQVASLAPAEEGDSAVASAVEQALADALVGPGGIIPTELARNLVDTPPRARPEQFTDQIERRQFGGRTRAELSEFRPPARPASEQALAALANTEPTELAIAESLAPRTRPSDIAALVRAARVQQEAAQVTASAAISAPDTSGAIEAALEEDDEPTNRAVRPRSLSIPTTASVARQATIENAIRLNRINLVGVYGAPTDRRALVRLSSGRYVKVKVGDRVDGGTVAQITDSQLYYRKGSRTLSLEVPQG